MLDIYQRESEQVRPQFFYTTNAKRGKDVSLIAQEGGESFELVEIEIMDDETATVFYTVVGAPPVFISVRPGERPEFDDIPDDDGRTDPETVLCVPDDAPGGIGQQLAAAQLDSGLAALEAADPRYRDALRLQFGLAELGQDGAGPRALRPAYRAPVLPVSVKVRFADGNREEFTLSDKCPALCLDPTENTVALALSPAIWAADLFFAVAETWTRCNKKTRKRLCAEYGINMQQFLKREEKYKNNISDR